MKFYFLPFALAIMSTTFLIEGCTDRHQYDAEIADLDSMKTEILAQQKEFLALDRERLIEHFDSISTQVKHVQSNFVGEMKLSTATMLESFKKLKGNIPADEEGFEKVDEEIKFGIEQIDKLKKLITEGATADAEGTKIDENYIRKAFTAEHTAAQDLVAKIKRMTFKNGAFFADFDSLNPKIKFLVDSIQVSPDAKPGFFSRQGENEEKD